jgi:hypothetical protein
MANCAVVNQETNLVENIIVASPSDTPPEGTFLVPIYQCDFGWQWVNDDVGFVSVGE